MPIIKVVDSNGTELNVGDAWMGWEGLERIIFNGVCYWSYNELTHADWQYYRDLDLNDPNERNPEDWGLNPNGASNFKLVFSSGRSDEAELYLSNDFGDEILYENTIDPDYQFVYWGIGSSTNISLMIKHEDYPQIVNFGLGCEMIFQVLNDDYTTIKIWFKQYGNGNGQ